MKICMNQKGSALVLVTTLTTLLLLVALTASIGSVSDIGLTAEEKVKGKLDLACESALNRARAKIEKSFNNGNITIPRPKVYFQGVASDNTGKTPGEKGEVFNEDYTLSDNGNDFYTFSIAGSDGSGDIIVNYSISPHLDSSTGDEEGWYLDGQTKQYNVYRMDVEAHAFTEKYGWVGMKETAINRRLPLFFYSIFFENDLEILPGPDMTITGKVHTNENMYLSANNTLSFNTDSLTAAGQMNRKRLDTGAVQGTVRVTPKGSSSYVNMNAGIENNHTTWVTTATNNWKGSVKDKYMGVQTQKPPVKESLEPGGIYDQKAGLKIIVKPNSNTKDTSNPYLFDLYSNNDSLTESNSLVASGLKLNCSTGQTNCINYYLNSSVSLVSFTDYRENKTVKLASIDVSKLKSSSYYPHNGIVYMHRTDSVKDSNPNDYTADASRVPNGFRLTSASALKNSTDSNIESMSFVSDQPVYVKGDYNLHTSSDPLTDKWIPSAIIGDSINLLSNNWSDSVTTKSPSASNTTYNMVFISGNTITKPNVSSSDNNYNGGFENFPRLLENWSSKTLTMKGSFMQLFRSQYATGRWNGSYYSPPSRNWSSEDRFQDQESIPSIFSILFPTVNVDVVFSGWRPISKEESSFDDPQLSET